VLFRSREEYANEIDRAVFPGIQGGPLMHVIAAKAVALGEALKPEFKDYQRQIVANAKALAGELQQRGFKLITGGTDNHLILVDVRPKGLTGLEAEKALDEVGITVNKNAIPFDPKPPRITSGIRLGTPAVTTRGMGKKEMQWLAEVIDYVLTCKGNQIIQEKAREIVKDLCFRFPIYQERGI